MTITYLVSLQMIPMLFLPVVDFHEKHSVFTLINVVGCGVYLLDMILNFTTGYVDHQRYEVSLVRSLKNGPTESHSPSFHARSN